jgi:hypothetical protein
MLSDNLPSALGRVDFRHVGPCAIVATGRPVTLFPAASCTAWSISGMLEIDQGILA